MKNSYRISSQNFEGLPVVAVTGEAGGEAGRVRRFDFDGENSVS
jgi:hypothetical protein